MDCRRSVADYVVRQLISMSITTVFGVHGANIEDLFDAAVRVDEMTPVIAKHEFAAGAMADGTARITGRPTVVMTTSGGGAMNVIPALAESYDSRVPVIALIGTAPSSFVGRGAFQDMLSPPDTVDIAGVVGGVTGSCSVVTRPDDVPAALATAFATTRRGLPAAVLLPKDVQSAQLPDVHVSIHPAIASPPTTDDVPAALLAAVADELCSTAESVGDVVIWAGDEASVAGIGSAIDRLAQALSAVVVVAPGGRDILRDAPGYAGVTGVMGHPSAHRALAAATVCLVIGCRMSMTDRAGLDDVLADKRVVHLGFEPPRMPGTADHIRCGAIEPTVDHLTSAVRERMRGRPRRRTTMEITHLGTRPPTTHLDMRTVIDELGAALPAGTTVFADAGNAGAAAIHHLPFGHGRFVVALGMGGMGYGVAAGIGNAIRSVADADPRRTVVIAGDGAFFMHGMELHTAIEHDAPVTVVVLNNNAHAMCITREKRFFPGTPSINRFRYTDVAAGLAAMFDGLTVVHVSDRDALRPAVADLLSRAGPNCLVVDVDPDEIPPFAPLLEREDHS
ncbi:thiamine pyrophosphate-binding protein [Gordonia sp. OPL2]|nr:thiamine pyrophosphate-binding protein [Gordonia sp. OPL2]